MSEEQTETPEAHHPTPRRLGNDTAQRWLHFAIDLRRVVAQLPQTKDPAARYVASPRIRSATSGGANDEEARAAERRDDWVHQVIVAAQEVRERSDWLRWIQDTVWAEVDVGAAIRAAGELTARSGASARTARTRPHR